MRLVYKILLSIIKWTLVIVYLSDIPSEIGGGLGLPDFGLASSSVIIFSLVIDIMLLCIPSSNKDKSSN